MDVRQPRPTEISPRSLADESNLVAGLLTLALLLRLPLLASLPPTIGEAESREVVTALSLLAGRWPLLEGLAGLGPGLGDYATALAVGLLGPTSAAVRLPVALAGALAVVPFYLLARTQCRRSAALAGAALLLGSLWALSSARQVSGQTWLVLYALLSAWALTRTTRSSQAWRWYALAGVLAGLALIEPPGGRWLLLGVVTYTVLSTARPERRGERALGAAVLLAAALLTCLVVQWPHPGGPATVLGAAFGASTGEQTLQGRVFNTLRALFLLDGAAVRASDLLPANRSPFDALAGVALLVGLYESARRWRSAALWVTLLAVPLAGNALAGGAALALDEVATALPFVYLIATLGFERVLGLPPARFGVWQVLVLALVPVVVAANTLEYYRWQTDPRPAQSRQVALPAAEVEAWARTQLLALAGGNVGPSLADWQRARGRPAAPVASQSAAPPARPAVAPAGTLEAALLLRLGQPGELVAPRGVAVAPDGDIYVADSGLRQVLRFDPEGRLRGSLGATFVEPYDVEVSAQGDVYVLDSQLAAVLRFDAAGNLTGTLGGKLGAYFPRGLGLDHLNRIYIADTGRDRVLVLSPEGELLGSIEKAALGGEQPTDVAVDAAGNVYVADPLGGRVLKFAPGGQYLLAWGINEASTIDSPHLAVTADGQIVASDPRERRLVLFTPEGKTLGALFGDDDGRLVLPLGVGADPAGHVYVVDKGDGTIKKYAP
ncbi:MAG: glycosyltransferase family 39 protein [Chloroflexota bacterium]